VRSLECLARDAVLEPTSNLLGLLDGSARQGRPQPSTSWPPLALAGWTFEGADSAAFRTAMANALLTYREHHDSFRCGAAPLVRAAQCSQRFWPQLSACSGPHCEPDCSPPAGPALPCHSPSGAAGASRCGGWTRT
jgi:hypothetical protein